MAPSWAQAMAPAVEMAKTMIAVKIEISLSMRAMGRIAEDPLTIGQGQVCFPSNGPLCVHLP